MQAVLVALIVAVFGFAGPYLLKRQDYKRQDELARAAHADADRIVVANEATTAAQSVTHDKLADLKGDVELVHEIVNSNTMRAERDAISRELVMMREIVKLHRALGHEPDDEALDAISDGQGRLVELTALLDAGVAAVAVPSPVPDPGGPS